jgi:hypothetical protein
MPRLNAKLSTYKNEKPVLEIVKIGITGSSWFLKRNQVNFLVRNISDLTIDGGTITCQMDMRGRRIDVGSVSFGVSLKPKQPTWTSRLDCAGASKIHSFSLDKAEYPLGDKPDRPETPVYGTVINESWKRYVTLGSHPGLTLCYN